MDTHLQQEASLSDDSSVLNLIPININRHRVTEYSDSQIQTDLSFKDIKVKNDINPVLAEVQTLGFFYMTEEERMDQLALMLSDDYSTYKTAYDPCVEFEKYVRETQSNSNNNKSKSRDNSQSKSRSSSRSRTTSTSGIDTRSVGSQTFFVAPEVDHVKKSDQHQSTQTINDASSVSSSTVSSPAHNQVKATTTTVIENDPTQVIPNLIKEKFSIKNNRDSSLEYAQSSEYNTDFKNNKIERVSSELHLADKAKADIVEDKAGKIILNDKTKSERKLVHSTIEMTSVVENKTTVTGISIKSYPEKFSIEYSNQNEAKSKPIDRKKESLNTIDLNKNKIDTVKTSEISVSDIIPKINFSQEKYDLNDKKSKLKPYVIECDDIEIVGIEDNGFSSGDSRNSSNRSKTVENEYSIDEIGKMFKFESKINKLENKKNSDQEIKVDQNPKSNDLIAKIKNEKPTSGNLNLNKNSVGRLVITDNGNETNIMPKIDEVLKNFNFDANLNQSKQITVQDVINPTILTSIRKNLNVSEMNTFTKPIGVKDEIVSNNQYSINKQIPMPFRYDSDSNQNQIAGSIKNTIKQIDKDTQNRSNNPNMMNNVSKQFKSKSDPNDAQFSISQIPKMYNFDANSNQAKTKPNSKLKLSDSIKKAEPK